MFRRNFLILFTGFIDYIGIGFIYPIFATLLFDRSLMFLPEATSDLLRGFYLGALLALMPLMQFFFSPILGKLSDLKGRKPIFILTLSIAFLGYVIAGIGIMAKSLTCLFLYRILVGMAAGNAAVAQAALTDKEPEENRSKAFTMFNMAMGAGYTIGPFLGGFLSEPNILFQGSFLTTFGFTATITLVNLLLIMGYYKETKLISKTKPKSILSDFFSIKKLLEFKGAKVVIMCMFIFSFGWSFLFEFIPVFLINKYGFSASQIGNFYGFSGAFYAISCAFLIHPILKRFCFSKILLTAFIASGIYAFVFLSISNPNFIWIYTPFLIYLIALIYPTLTTLTSTKIEQAYQGEALGGLISVQSLAYGISPLFSGFIVGLYHEMPIFLAGVSFLLAGGIFGFYYFKGYLEPAEP